MSAEAMDRAWKARLTPRLKLALLALADEECEGLVSVPLNALAQKVCSTPEGVQDMLRNMQGTYIKRWQLTTQGLSTTIVEVVL